MAVPGFRSTAPVKLYIELSKQPLVDLEGGNRSGIEDPFDLKNCFTSFDYKLNDGKESGVFNVTLINPSQQVEEKIFSWYCAVNPRAWKAQETGTPTEWSFSAGQNAILYLRWGYDSQDENFVRDAAWSHIHKVQLYDIDFTVSDSKDRVIKLKLLNFHDIGILLHKGKGAKQERTNYYAPIFDEEGNVIPPAQVISTIIGNLAAGDGIQAFVNLSDEHQQKLNAEFSAIHVAQNQEVPAELERQTTPPKDRISLKSSKPNQITFDIINQYYQYLDMGVVIDQDIPEELAPSSTPSAKPSTDQTGVTGGQTDAQAVERNKDAAAIQYEEIITYDGGVSDGTLLDYNIANPYFGPANLPRPVYRYRLINPYTAEREFTLDNLMLMLEEDILYFLPLPEYEQQPGFDQAYLYPPKGYSKFDYLGVSGYETPYEGGLTKPKNRYVLSDYPEIFNQVKILYQEALQRRQDFIQNSAPQNTDQDITEDQAVIDENVPDEVKAPEEPPKDRSNVSVSCSDKNKYLYEFVDSINKTFFDSAAEYIDIRYLELDVVPEDKREEVEKALAPAGASVDWEGSDSICMIGSLSFNQGVLAFNREIKSFDIQVDGSPDKISMATGFNQRKDNIIVSLEHRISKNSFYANILNAPVISQKLYSVIKRFESEEYRDVVNEVLRLGMSRADASVLAPAGVSQGALLEKIPYLNGVPVASTTVIDELAVGSNAFPADVAEKSISQASRLIEGLDNEVLDSSIGPQPAPINPIFFGASVAIEAATREFIKSQVEADLEFIRNSDFLDIFFPFISSDKLEDTKVKMWINNKKLDKDRKYRFITQAPLSVLQEKLSANSPEEAMVLAAKLRTLFAFKKNISNVRLKTLGVPEMDILSYETGVRKLALWVSEPRVPGTFHWITGIYQIVNVSHHVDVNQGYTSEITLIPTAGDTADELLTYGYTFLTSNA